MKPNELIEQLYKLNQDLDICVFTSSGAYLLRDVEIGEYEGMYEDPDKTTSHRLIRTEGTFIGFGDPDEGYNGFTYKKTKDTIDDI